jgi:peptidoglycan/LPS O-acetylase OafA/YrhL
VAEDLGKIAVSDRGYPAFRYARYFGALDGLRCISILAVIWWHSDPHSRSGLLGKGYLGVELFFVISGFLITTLLLREKDENSQISLRNFYIRRTLRIFPLYYLILAIYVVLVLRFERRSPAGAEFFQNLPFFLTYTSNWFLEIKPGKRLIFDFAWSLATEEQFYAAWPWLIRFSRSWRLPVLFMGGSLLVNQLAKLGLSNGYLDRSLLLVRILASIATPICLGCLAAYVLHRDQSFRFAYAVAGKVWSAPLAAALLIFTLALSNPPLLLVHLAMTYLVVTCCIRSDHLLQAVLANRVIRYVGTISYGMYLLHMLAINAARRIAPEWGAGAFFVLGSLVTVALASISYWLLERPILRIKERFENRPAPAIPASAAVQEARAASER